MSLLTQASLIVTPNAVKEGKLYSIIPSNGNGDMTVVRATATATRINELGLVEFTPYNLVTYSEMFADASWIKTNSATVTANTDISPNGTLTADRLTAGASFAQVQNTATVVSGSVYTVSVWIKRITGTGQVYLRSIENVNTPITITNDWVRYSLTTTATSAIGRIGVALQTSGDVVAIWGAQLVQGSVPKDYFYTTDRLNVPRLNYDSVGGCPSILIEPQRTNQLIFCSDLSNSIWLKTNYALSSVASIQGLTTTRITKNSTNNGLYNGTGARSVIHNLGTSAAAIKTFSCLIRKGNTNKVGLLVNNVLVGVLTVITTDFNFTTKTFSNTSAGLTVSYENLTTDIYKFILTFNDTSASTLKAIWIAPIDNSNNTVTDGYLDIAYFQLEEGSYPTSFIPTTSAIVTRNQDIISKTGISDLLGQTEGTFFVEISALSNDLTTRIVELSDGANVNRVVIQFSTLSNNIRMDTANSSGNYRAEVTVTNILSNNKVLVKWGALGIFGFINGVKYTFYLASGTGNGIPASLNMIVFSRWFNQNQFYGKCKGLQVYKTALTDSECIALTTL